MGYNGDMIGYMYIYINIQNLINILIYIYIYTGSKRSNWGIERYRVISTQEQLQPVVATPFVDTGDRVLHYNNQTWGTKICIWGIQRFDQ